MNRQFLTRVRTPFRVLIGTLLLSLSLLHTQGYADSATEININADAALERFRAEVAGADRFLQSAVGVLVFPRVLKAGFGIGGEYGEGVLRMGGTSVEYYSTAAASIGFQLGAQSKAVFILFMDSEALEKFRSAQGWRAGVDGSISLIKIGAGGIVDTNTIQDPMIGFVLTNAGLMYNLTLEGSKFTRLSR
ncbi:MAG: YSC84-related protein [Pseudomonadales bacterium]|nr:YSC84-related protein [Pseudomonadales bacterium]